MTTGDMPMISDASHSHSTYGLSNLASLLAMYTGTSTANPFVGLQQGVAGLGAQRSQNIARALILKAKANPIQLEEKSMSRRLIQVFIADPDENMPLENSMLYTGEQKLTDATDQELFFEIDMKSILEAHNAKRVTLINKKVKERTENLEPAKIRDLRMVVVNVATF